MGCYHPHPGHATAFSEPSRRSEASIQRQTWTSSWLMQRPGRGGPLTASLGF